MTLSVLERELLTIPETASRLRVSEKTVRRLVRAGILPAVRVSAGAIRIEADELDDWLDERRTHQDAGASSSSRPPTPAAHVRDPEASAVLIDVATMISWIDSGDLGEATTGE
jgi:excisionase family DNA binding protein